MPSVKMAGGDEPNNLFYNPTSKTWESKPKKDNRWTYGVWNVAKSGVLTLLSDDSSIVQYAFGGLDANSNPIWDAANATVTKLSAFNNLGRVAYDSDTDALYVAGDVFNNNGDFEYGSFMRIKKFPDWSKGNVTASYSIDLPYKDNEYAGVSNYGGGAPVSMDIAGDYIFVIYGMGNIRIMNKSDGALVGTLVQNVNGWSGSDGQVDTHRSMTVTKRTTGEYVVLFENAAWANIMMQRWCPAGDGCFVNGPGGSASGGASGAGAAGAGAATGSGGATGSGSSGSGAKSGAGANAGAANSAAGASDSTSGCGCRVATTAPVSGGFGLASLGLLGTLVSRRRRQARG